MRIKSFVVTIPLLLLLAACGPKVLDTTIAEGGKKLSGEEISTLVSGNTLHMEEYGIKAKIECFKNGKLTGSNSENTKTFGQWQVDEKEELCLRFKRWGGAEDFCYAIWQVGDEYRQLTSNGAQAGAFTVEKGTGLNPNSTASNPVTSSSTSSDQQPETYRNLPAPEMHAEKDIRFFHLEMAQDCPGCDLAGISLEGARLINANLPGANLTRAQLHKSNLRSANLRGANLEKADLSEANLAGADLSGANLSDADLTNTNLTRTNLKNADLKGARGADLSKAFR
ncbi:MAG: pentapeptide repeat-containing protein [Desulfobulbaceae bacterium]|nr:pentapeptide repeat-containing protein [Desulfobulbaceae bacterium]